MLFPHLVHLLIVVEFCLYIAGAMYTLAVIILPSFGRHGYLRRVFRRYGFIEGSLTAIFYFLFWPFALPVVRSAFRRVMCFNQ